MLQTEVIELSLEETTKTDKTEFTTVLETEMFKQSLVDQLAGPHKALKKSETYKENFTTSLEAGKANFAETQKSLTALVASQGGSQKIGIAKCAG